MNHLASLLLLILFFTTIKPETMKHPDITQPETITINGKTFQESIPHSVIKKRVKELGQQITQDYTGKKILFIGVLNGAAIFMSDLVREVGVECEIDFLKVSSYGNATKSSGTITLSKEVSAKIADRHVIIVEDIIESGLTINFVRDHILKSNPASVAIASLLNKNLCKLEFPINYVGFDIPEEFVIGYGLDYAQTARNLKSIYKLASENESK